MVDVLPVPNKTSQTVTGVGYFICAYRQTSQLQRQVVDVLPVHTDITVTGVGCSFYLYIQTTIACSDRWWTLYLYLNRHYRQ